MCHNGKCKNKKKNELEHYCDKNINHLEFVEMELKINIKILKNGMDK